MQPSNHATTQPQHRKLYLVDGYGFVFRAYHVMPPFSDPQGTPVGAVYGFTNMLVKLLKDHKPDYMAVAFDAGSKTFRNEIYTEYKANRPEAPEDLKPQFALVRDAAKAVGLKSFELVGYEADDIIATFVSKACEQGIEVTIISSDKDLMQLVKDGDCPVKMFDPVKNKYIGEKEVLEKFGVAPNKVLDVSALIGDSSDNVPGVPGIGPKTAAELINEYGDLDSLLERAGEIKQNKRREVMIANTAQAKLSRELIKLDYNVPIAFNFDDLKTEKSNEAGLLEFAKKHGFKSIIAKLSLTAAHPALDAGFPEIPRQARDVRNAAVRKILKDIPELITWLQNPLREGRLAVDYIDDAAVAFACGTDSAFIKYGTHKPSEGFDFDNKGGITHDDVNSALSEIFANPAVLKIFHDYKDTSSCGLTAGIPRRDLAVEPQGDVAKVTPIDDLQIMEYVLNTGLTNGSVESMAPELPQYITLCGTGRNKRALKDVPPEELANCAFDIVEFIEHKQKESRQELFNKKLLTVYEKIEKPLINVIAKIENRGAKIDKNKLAKMSERFATKMAALEKEVYLIAQEEFNLGSPAQIGEILFGKLGLAGGKKSKKTGKYSTGAEVLEELAEQGHEIAQKLLHWRQLSKLKSTYTDALPQSINPKTGRVHTTFAMTVASTGRLSSTEPNLQNIPIRTEEGREIRTTFIAEPGYKLISADYSQIELRLLADVADIPAMKEAFRTGQDVHAITAHQVLGVPMDQITQDHRRIAKTINFGIIYGVSAHGLSWRLKIPREVAAQYIKQYFAQYVGIRKYMDDTIQFCREHGYVETIYGRKCYIRGINDKNGAVRQFSERAAINAPLQGAAADIIKKAMIELDRKNLPMILQVHDELLFEVKAEEAAEKLPQIKAIMENAAMLSVPILVEAAVGDNWGEAH